MIGTARAQLGESRRVVGVHELQHFVPHFHRRDLTLLCTDLAAQPRKQFGEHTLALGLWQRLHARAAEVGTSTTRVEKVLRAPDQLEGQFIAFLVVIGPVDKAVLAHDRALCVRMLSADPLQLQPELEARPLPVGPDDVVAVDLARERRPILRRGERDDRHGMHVIDVRERDIRVQRRVDARRGRIAIEGGVRIHPHHGVFSRRLGATLLVLLVQRAKREHLIQVERREVGLRRRAEIAAGALDPQHALLLSGERVRNVELRRCITATRVGDARIRAEDVGAVDQSLYRIHRRRGRVVPAAAQVVVRGAVGTVGFCIRG